MKNYKKFKVFFIIIIAQFVYSQHPISGVVEYKVELYKPLEHKKIDTSNEASKLSLKKDLFKESGYFVLSFNFKESSYKDTETNLDTDGENKINFLKTLGGGKQCNYYTNLEDRITYAGIHNFGENMIVSYPFPKWEITNETKYIDKYMCYKAYRYYKGKISEKMEVWFTPEIPFQFGPELYVGLPGLVLEVDMGKIRFIATKINLETEQEIKMEKPIKGIRLTEEEYHKKVMEIANEMGF